MDPSPPGTYHFPSTPHQGRTGAGEPGGWCSGDRLVGRRGIPLARHHLGVRPRATVMTTTEHPRAELPPDGPTATSVESHPDPPPNPTAESGPDHRVRTLLTATAAYLVLSLFLWWHVWTTHPTSTTTCGCGDSSLFTWFLAWPAYAISHGLNPLYSTALFHPSGVNLLSNTAEVGIGGVLAPVTWLFGPVATLNVALTLSPVLSALAMFVLLRRWVSWTPAAFIGGLAYGFSPFILIALTDAHLMLAMAPIPPLMVACLDEMVVRQRHRPLASGVLLGVLVFVQFFIGSEVLVLVVIAAAIGIALLILYGLVHRDALRSRIHHAVAAVVAAGITATVLLAYPVWFALAGPARLSGPIWGTSDISYGGNDLRDYLLPSTPSPAFTALDHHFGGYQAPTLSGQYFGIGLIAVLVIGVVALATRPPAVAVRGGRSDLGAPLDGPPAPPVDTVAPVRAAPADGQHHPQSVPAGHLSGRRGHARADRRPCPHRHQPVARLPARRQ